MSEYETDAPLDAPPTDFHHTTYESLDPEKSPEPEIRGDQTGLDEAAAGLTQTRAERNEVVERTWGDPRDWSKHAPGNRTVSAEHASDMLKETREAEARLAQAEMDAQLAAGVDEFRGQQPQVEQPPVEQQPDFAPQPEALPEQPRGKLAVALSDPEFVREFQQAYGQSIAQVEQAKAQYQQAVAQTLLTAEASALAPFPELIGVPRDQIDAVMAHISRTNPQRHAEIRRHVATVKELAGAHIQQAHAFAQQQQQAQQQQVEAQKEQFQRFAAYHDERVAAVPREVTDEVVAMAQEHGISKQELMELYNTNAVMRHSAFQQMMADAAKYRLAQRSVAKAAVRPVPQVQKPGVASEEARDRSAYSDLERQYRGQSLTPKQAAQLLIAKRAR